MAHIYAEITTAAPSHVAPAIRHIILPLDGSRFAELSVEPAIVLARAFGADVSLVRCYELASHLVPDHAAQAFLNRKSHLPLHAASLYLARMEERFRQRGVSAHSHLYQWPATSAILETTSHSANALIVMATRAGSVDRKQLESITGNIMEAGVAPVLVLSADTRVPFASGALHGLRVLAVDSQSYPEVEAYARLLADRFYGTVTHATSPHVTERRANGSDDQPAEPAQPLRQDTQAIDALAALERVGADVVVLKESPRLDGALGDGGALKSLLTAGLPVIVVP